MEAIVAVYTDWGIGSDGTQPIVVPEDRRRFAEITRGATLIVGSKTLLDFPGSGPLKGRRNLIMTRHEGEIPGAEVVHTPEEAVELCRETSASSSWAARRFTWPCSPILTGFTSPR